jgi:hypothetical protein
MPLTGFQAHIGRLLAVNRSEDSYLAGGGGRGFAVKTVKHKTHCTLVCYRNEGHQ